MTDLLRLTCPACGYPRLKPETETGEHRFDGSVVRVEGLEFCACPQCQQRVVLDVQAARNRERIAVSNMETAAAKWESTRVFKWPTEPEPQSNKG